MTDLPTDLPGHAGDDEDPPGERGSESIQDTRAFITQRMQELAVNAMKIYEAAVRPGAAPRNIQTQLMAARDIVEMLTEGKLQAPVVAKQRPLASVTDLAAISEQVRLAKQAERRGGR